MTHTCAEAQKCLAVLLDQAAAEGEVKIRREHGRRFVIRPEATEPPPLDVEGMALDVTTDEIVALVRAGRRLDYLSSAEDELSGA